LRHALIGVGRFEKTNTAIVGVPVPKASLVTWAPELPSGTQSTAVRFCGAADRVVAPTAIAVDVKNSRLPMFDMIKNHVITEAGWLFRFN
jgi:hypothetical protein